MCAPSGTWLVLAPPSRQANVEATRKQGLQSRSSWGLADAHSLASRAIKEKLQDYNQAWLQSLPYLPSPLLVQRQGGAHAKMQVPWLSSKQSAVPPCHIRLTK